MLRRRAASFAAGTLALVALRPAFAQQVDPDPTRWPVLDHDTCAQRAKTQAELDACPPPSEPLEVRVQAKPPARSASDWQVDERTLRGGPRASSLDVLRAAPGVYVSDRGLPGRAPHLSLRGFDGTSGQDVEIFAGNIPLNQVSHIRAPGYADMRLVMPEVVRSVRISNGPYDPSQGDFAVAGSMHMDLGLEKPGFWAKGGVGSFGSRRVFVAFAPESKELADTFAAFETDSTDGPGGARGGERSSFVGQVGGGERQVQFHGTVAIGSARYDFPGYLPLAEVEAGGDPYRAILPLGRDRTSQALAGADVIWTVGEGTLGIGLFAGKTRTTFHQDLTGYVLDALEGTAPTNPDDAEQVDDDKMFGLTTLYRHAVHFTSARDSLSIGVSARVDSVDQTDTRLFADGTTNEKLVDATIDATNVGAFVDASLYPLKGVVVRGGPRLDSLSYSVTDRVSRAGTDRTSQGFHLGNKAMVDVATGGGVHLVASYGEGFRSPQARDLTEGERVPFTSVRSVEGGLRYKELDLIQASAVGFGSWLGHDRVFDATARERVEAPPSVRAGGVVAVNVWSNPLGASVSATYARARFTGSSGPFVAGDPVPYAPELVVRDDMFVAGHVGRIRGARVTARAGVGLSGIAGRYLPDGTRGRDFAEIDAVAAAGWRALEIAVNGTNLTDARLYDAEYVYASNFEKRGTVPAPSPHVLVGAPRAVFVTLQVHLRGEKSEYDKGREHECLAIARDDDERDACRE